MSIYLIAQLDIHDRATYAKYASAFMEIFNRYGGKLLSVEEAPEVLAGEWSCTRTVLSSFDPDSSANGTSPRTTKPPPARPRRSRPSC